MSNPQLPFPADGAAHPLDPRALTLARLAVELAVLPMIGLPLLVLGLLALAGVLSGLWLLPGVVLPLALGAGLDRHARLAYRHSSIALDLSGLRVERGAWWRHSIYVPRSRVQHTDVSQGPLERHFQLGTLVLYTAGTEHARIAVSGLRHEVALAIRDNFLLGTAVARSARSDGDRA